MVAPHMAEPLETDYLVIGSGIAGLNFALLAAEHGREGAHSHNRVVHWQDMTGREIQRALLEAVARNPRITVLHDQIAVDLLSMAKYGGDPACFGAYVLDRARGEVKTILARATVLA